MKRHLLLGLAAAGCLAPSTEAADIYVLSCGEPPTDTAVLNALQAHGHAVTMGVEYTQFNGTINLAGYDAVLLQANANWTDGPMPGAGQQQLVDWVLAGGRLVTTEWVTYFSDPGLGNFVTIGTITPLIPAPLFGSSPSTTLSLATPEPEIDAGVPASFSCGLTNYGGTEGFFTPRIGAIVHYTTSNGGGRPGLASIAAGAGRVFSFSSTCGSDQFASADFARLFSNVFGAGGEPPCAVDWNGDDQVNSSDISAFLAGWLASLQGPCGTLDADFNGDLQVNSSDISAFLTAWLDAVTNGC